MLRREFIQRTSALTAVLALPDSVTTRGTLSASTVVPLSSPAPISESERDLRRAKAQRLMAQLGFAAMLVEPGANMVYFTGIEWARSERLFAFLLPATGKPVDIPFVGLMTVEDGKMASFRVYFDTGDLMRQLGISST